MPVISDKAKFFNISPQVAAEIFTYSRENTEVGIQQWEFEKAYISEDGHAVLASFWFGALAGWGKDKLTISASKNEDGSWNIKHEIKRAP